MNPCLQVRSLVTILTELFLLHKQKLVRKVFNNILIEEEPG